MRYGDTWTDQSYIRVNSVSIQTKYYYLIILYMYQSGVRCLHTRLADSAAIITLLPLYLNYVLSCSCIVSICFYFYSYFSFI